MNENTPSAELLPCPWCKRVPAVNANITFTCTWLIKHEEGCYFAEKIGCHEQGFSEAGAKRWNRRPSPAQFARDERAHWLKQLAMIRDALIAGDVSEAHHQLYVLADPTFTVPNAVEKLLGAPDFEYMDRIKQPISEPDVGRE